MGDWLSEIPGAITSMLDGLPADSRHAFDLGFRIGLAIFAGLLLIAGCAGIYSILASMLRRLRRWKANRQ